MRSTIGEKEITKHKIPLETMHMVDRNDVICPCFRGGQIGVDEYIVQKSQFRLHYERVLCRTQLNLSQS